MQYPSFFPRAPVMNAFPGREQRHRAYNRTGGALVSGGIYQMDVAKSQAETTSLLWDDPASIWRNVVAPGTTIGTSGIATTVMKDAFFLVATNTAADNTEAEFILAGLCTISLIGAANAVYAPMSVFGGTSGQTYGTMNVAATSKWLGYGLVETANYGATPAATAYAVYFYGWGLLNGG